MALIGFTFLYLKLRSQVDDEHGKKDEWHVSMCKTNCQYWLCPNITSISAALSSWYFANYVLVTDGIPVIVPVTYGHEF